MSGIQNPQPLNGGDGARAANSEGADANAVEISRYVADICGELSKMSKAAHLKMLSYLLSMARQEADRIARGGPGAN